MAGNKKTYLFYDKYCDDIAAYTNVKTKDITMSKLFESNYKYTEGLIALNKINAYKKSKKDEHLFSKTLLEHGGLYGLYFFEYTNDNSEYKIIIVSVDDVLIENYYNQNNENIPEKEFLIRLCNYDTKYKSCGKKITLNIADNAQTVENTNKIINASIHPNADATDPIQEQLDITTIPLYEYQKKSIKWMILREHEKNAISINDHEVALGNVICNYIQHKFYNLNDRDNVIFHGGALIDEVGLGKTYQMICMSLCNRCENNIADKLNSKATLIICPTQLAGQWEREIKSKIKPEANIKTILLLTKIHINKYTYEEILNADFIITTLTFLENKSFLDTIPENKSKTQFTAKLYSYYEIENNLKKFKDNFNNTFMKNTDVAILAINWHRIIIDEFHELENETYKTIRTIIQHFKSNYKWCVSGTPFNNQSKSLCEMFEFVTNYINRYKIKKELLLNDDIVNYTKKYFFRRNTKQSVIEENKLPSLKESVFWLNFSKTEWIIYNSYLANENINKFDTVLRQLCCHPKIAEEIKSSISTCKTLDEIEKVMVSHYEKDMITAEKKMTLEKYRQLWLLKKLEIVEFKQYAKFLRLLGYKIKFNVDDNDEEYEKEIEKISKSFNNTDELNLEFLKNQDDKLKDDEDTKENKNKKLFIVSNETKDEIIEKIGKDKLEEKTIYQVNLENYISTSQEKIKILTKEYNGKKNTFEYYINAVNKLKNISQKENNDDDDDDDDNVENCGICLGSIKSTDTGIIPKCGHMFCYNCVKPFIVSKRECPMCKCKVKETDIFLMIKDDSHDVKDKVEFKNKNELINLIGTKLTNLIFFVKKNNKHTIIFSQWDSLLKKVGEELDNYGIKNIFCKGNVWQRDKAIREFNTDDKIKVIMLSSESAASGTNLTKAEIVILLDPISGSYEYRRNTEWQAIGRAYRMGQTKNVEVIRFIVKNTVEEEIYNQNKKYDEKNKVINFIDKENMKEMNDDNIVLENGEIDELKNNILNANQKPKRKNAKKKEKIIEIDE